MKHSISEINLKNGVRGLIIHVPDAGVMNIEVSFRAGEYLAHPDKWEVPHLMEHILLGANKLYPKSRLFQAEIEKNGAYTNASTDTFDIVYEAECADFDWQRVLNLMLLAITKPLFLENEFKSEYGNVREELISRSNNHFRTLSLNMRAATGFIAKSDRERIRLMKNVGLADIIKHYKRTHTSKNLRFVVGGNFTPSRVRELKRMLGNIELPSGRRFVLPNEKPKKLDQALQIRNRSVENLYVYIDTFCRRRFNEVEEDALSLANTILTGTLYSRILGTARERGLLYDMGSGIALPKCSTNWWFGAQVTPENAPPFLNITIDEISKLLAGELDEADLSAAKDYSLGRYQRTAQTVGAVVSGYSQRYFFDEVIEDYYRVPNRIHAVTKASIIDASRAMFAEKLWAFGALGRSPKEFIDQLHDQLAVLWR